MTALALRPQDLFSALSDRVRVRIACCLAASPDELCVCELTDALDLPQPTVSRHLRVMKDAGLLEERREGRWVYYRLRSNDHPVLDQIRCCVETVCSCPDPDIQHDVRRLRTRLALREGGKCVVGLTAITRRSSSPEGR